MLFGIHPVDSGEGKASCLKYGGGVGYKSEYTAHTYELPDGDQQAKSLTAYIAQKMESVRATEKVLASRPLPYTGACRRYIASETFRNILGMPLLDRLGDGNSWCWGVLKIENRKPEARSSISMTKGFATLCHKTDCAALKKLEELSKGHLRGRGLGAELLAKSLGLHSGHMMLDSLNGSSG